MEFKKLGATSVRIPDIGLGTWKYAGGIAPLRAGMECGACLIDTAEVYGTEEVVGEAVRGVREQAFVATKVLPFQLSSIGPWLTLTVTAILILVLDALSPKSRKVCFSWLAVAGLAVAAIQTIALRYTYRYNWNSTEEP